MWINSVWAIATIAQELVVIAVTYEATLFVSDQPIRAFGNEPLLHTLQIGRIKHTSGFGTVDRPCVLCSRL
jgi:hypothetical protein